jgi:short-subunit dehydrogenase
MTNKTYVVTGTTGSVGKVVVEKFKAQGHHVRPVSRSAGVSFDAPQR